MNPDSIANPVVRFSCGSCGKAMRAKRELVGKKVRCACGQAVPIVDSAAPATAARPAPARKAAVAPTPAVVPESCHYCGGSVADHLTAILYPKTEEAKTFAAQEHQRKESGLPGCKDVYVRDKNAGYGQRVSIPRCKSCRSFHALPWYVTLVAVLVCLPLTILLSSMGYWVNIKTVVTGLSEPFDPGDEGRLAMNINAAVGANESKYFQQEKDGKTRLPIWMVLLLTATIYLLPVMVVGGLAFWIAALVQRFRAPKYGIRTKGDVLGYPPIEQQVAQGWNFEIVV
jgi:hypothetical protein